MTSAFAVAKRPSTRRRTSPNQLDLFGRIVSDSPVAEAPLPAIVTSEAELNAALDLDKGDR
jgi:hypothetical protein